MIDSISILEPALNANLIITLRLAEFKIKHAASIYFELTF